MKILQEWKECHVREAVKLKKITKTLACCGVFYTLCLLIYLTGVHRSDNAPSIQRKEMHFFTEG